MAKEYRIHKSLMHYTLSVSLLMANRLTGRNLNKCENVVEGCAIQCLWNGKMNNFAITCR